MDVPFFLSLWLCCPNTGVRLLFFLTVAEYGREHWFKGGPIGGCEALKPK